jgi:hypothetical protein
METAILERKPQVIGAPCLLLKFRKVLRSDFDKILLWSG